MQGIFITFEGVEGAGKSTQIERLRQCLDHHNIDYVYTREPGGPPIAEKIRALLLDKNHGEMEPLTEVLLYMAGRAQNTLEIVRPALAAGKVVICDRYADSSVAYQGAGRKIDVETVCQLNAIATTGLRPDITFILDLPVQVGLQRLNQQGEKDRIEQEAIDFHQRVRDRFLTMAAAEPERFVVLDALQTPEIIFQEIRYNLMDRFASIFHKEKSYE